MIISADENTEAQSGEGQLLSFFVNGGQDTLLDKFMTFAGVSGNPLSATVEKLNLGEEKLAEISLLLPS